MSEVITAVDALITAAGQNVFSLRKVKFLWENIDFQLNSTASKQLLFIILL